MAKAKCKSMVEAKKGRQEYEQVSAKTDGKKVSSGKSVGKC